MKRALGFAYFCLSHLLLMDSVTAQSQISEQQEVVFEVKDVDQLPDFPGGLDRFYHDFNLRFHPPKIPDLLGKVFISFIVEPDGTLTDIHILKDVGFGIGQQAQEIVTQSPRWIPGKKDGQRVRVHYILPIPIQTHTHD